MVGDFGGACLLPIGTETGTPHAVTAQTVAPEIAAHWDAASFRSDIYSLGATAYWLLAGRPSYQFPEEANFEQRLAIVAGTAPPRVWDIAPHVPSHVARTIDKAMARDPADRLSTVGELAATLGSRPAVKRRWQRTDEHEGHLGCWRGEARNGGVYITCVEQGQRMSQAVIVSKHLVSGRRITSGCRTVYKRALSQSLRSVFRALE